MKWFKHDCDMHTDLKIQSLIEKHGLEGYGIWNLCLEMVGKEGKKGKIDGQLRWIQQLSKVAYFNDEDKVRVILETMAAFKLICPKAFKYGNLYIPKFIKRADDYTMRQLRTSSEQTTKNIHVDKNRIEEIRKEYIALKKFKVTLDNGEEDKELIGYLCRRNARVINNLLFLTKGDLKVVIDAMRHFGTMFDKKGLSWSLETIEKWLPDYLVRGKDLNYAQLQEKFGLKESDGKKKF